MCTEVGGEVVITTSMPSRRTIRRAAGRAPASQLTFSSGRRRRLGVSSVRRQSRRNPLIPSSFSPGGIRPGEKLLGISGLRRLWRRTLLTPRRLLLPDENVSWLAGALPAARRIVRREGIDVVITTSPPTSVHMIGAHLRRHAGVRWIA